MSRCRVCVCVVAGEERERAGQSTEEQPADVHVSKTDFGEGLPRNRRRGVRTSEEGTRVGWAVGLSTPSLLFRRARAHGHHCTAPLHSWRRLSTGCRGATTLACCSRAPDTSCSRRRRSSGCSACAWGGWAGVPARGGRPMEPDAMRAPQCELRGLVWEGVSAA